MVARSLLVAPFLVASLLTACGDDGGSAGDDDAIDARPRTCVELGAAWVTASAEVDTRCSGDGDCRVFGGHVGLQSCNCSLWLDPVGGRSAPAAVTAILDEYETACAGDQGAPRLCDAGLTRSTCVNGTCRVDTPSCLDPRSP
jgi:hypothetical protein